MSQQMSLDRMLADWMVDETTGGLPDHVFDQIVTTTGQRRPLPLWLAVLREPPMRTQSQVAVGVPRRQFVLIGVVLVLAAAVAIGVAAAILLKPQPASADWPGFRGDAAHAGLAVQGPVGNPVVRWQYHAAGAIDSDLAVVGDLVIVPSDDGSLTAIDITNAAPRWRFTGTAPMHGPFAATGKVYVADGDGVIRSLDASDGKVLWTAPALSNPSDLVVIDGTLLVGTGNGTVVALDGANGTERWHASIASGTAVHAPAVAASTVVVTTEAGDVVALDLATGHQLWKQHASDNGVGTPVVSQGLVYVGASADSTSGRLVAYDLATGVERWHDDTNIYSPSIADDIGVSGSAVGTVAAFDPATGQRRWTGALTGGLRAPALAGDVVYVSADSEHRIVALDRATGGELWSFDVDAPNLCCIAAAKGLVLMGTSAGTVYAIGGDGAHVTAKGIPVASQALSPTLRPSAVAASPVPTTLPATATFVWAATSGAADFNSWGLAQAPDGNLWTTEGFANRFSIFKPDGTFVESWGTSGKGDGQFDLTRANGDPFGMVVFAPDGSFYVLDVGNHRVQAFDAKREFVQAWGSFGAKPGQFQDPVGLAIDPDGNVNVLDNTRGVVETFDSKGNVLRTVPAFPSEVGASDGANQLTIGPDGHIYMSLIRPNEVIELDRNGTLVSTFGGPGSAGAFAEQPFVIALDAAGRRYITQGPERGAAPGVVVFDTDGHYLGGFGPLGGGDADLGFPWGLVVTDDGIYVADAGAVIGAPYRSLIRKFDPLTFP